MRIKGNVMHSENNSLTETVALSDGTNALCALDGRESVVLKANCVRCKRF